MVLEVEYALSYIAIYNEETSPYYSNISIDLTVPCEKFVGIENLSGGDATDDSSIAEVKKHTINM